MTSKTIQPMPKCLDKGCINGVVVEKRDGVFINKICGKCERMERDMEESEDYIVYYKNGRAEGYELIEK